MHTVPRKVGEIHTKLSRAGDVCDWEDFHSAKKNISDGVMKKDFSTSKPRSALPWSQDEVVDLHEKTKMNGLLTRTKTTFYVSEKGETFIDDLKPG